MATRTLSLCSLKTFRVNFIRNFSYFQSKKNSSMLNEMYLLKAEKKVFCFSLGKLFDAALTSLVHFELCRYFEMKDWLKLFYVHHNLYKCLRNEVILSCLPQTRAIKPKWSLARIWLLKYEASIAHGVYYTEAFCIIIYPSTHIEVLHGLFEVSTW